MKHFYLDQLTNSDLIFSISRLSFLGSVVSPAVVIVVVNVVDVVVFVFVDEEHWSGKKSQTLNLFLGTDPRQNPMVAKIKKTFSFIFQFSNALRVT